MKIPFNKKILMTAGLFIACFAVINAGMYFFLQATQPKIGHRAEGPKAQVSADSLKLAATVSVDSIRRDSTAEVTAPVVAHDTTTAVNVAASAVAETTVAEAPLENVTATVDTPSADENEQLSEAPEETNADEAVSSLESGDSRQMAKLAKLLESMKPAEAADIASHLTTDQIVILVMKMKDRTAGRMLAALPIEQAAQVAERMSQMSRTASRGD